MRVSYLLLGLRGTGGSIVLYNFMDKLSEKGYEVYAITPKQRIKWSALMSKQVIGNLGKTKEVNKLKIILNHYPWLKRLIKSIIPQIPSPHLVDELKQLTINLLRNWIESDITIATHCFTAYANLALMDKTIPLYHMQHYEELFFEDELRQKAARLTYFMPFKLIANSTWLKNQIKQRFGKGADLLYPAVSQKIFHPYQDINQKYSYPQKIRIVSYASKRKIKGFEDAVKAMQEVFSKLDSQKIEWVVFGEHKPEGLNVPVKYMGQVFNEELARLYSSAHIVFMPSWYESFPLPPLEAMNCGSAVIATQIGTEDYLEDKVNSLVVSPRNPAQLAQAILLLINNLELARQIAMTGYESARKFDWDNSASQLDKILKEAIQDKHIKSPFMDIGKLAQGQMT